MEQKNTVNGINVSQLRDTTAQVKENPAMAQFQFRANNTWIDGTHQQATVNGFYGALKEENPEKPWTFAIDEPGVLLGQNRGPSPADYLLVALSGCLTTTLVANAAAQGITINKVESRYEADWDLQGFLGLSEEVPVGFKTIRVYFTIDADISDEKKKNLIMLAQQYSPVANTIAKPVPVVVQLDQS